MNISTSEYTSRSESGWTLYLDQSSQSHSEDYFRKGDVFGREGTKMGEEEEDLSMVSDASSGPPPHQQQEGDQFYYGNGWPSSHSSACSKFTRKGKKKKHEIKEDIRSQYTSHLDDTASSPVFSYSKKKVGFSGNEEPENNELNFSQAEFQDKSTLQKHLSFFKPSLGGKEVSK